MKIKPSVFGFRLRGVGLRQPIPAGLVGLLSLICGARLQAGEGSPPLIRSAVVSAPSESIGWMSGGVGEADRDEMRKSAAAYNVWVVFSDRSGHYLANVPFTVEGTGGRRSYTAVSEGPLLYLKLPPGDYRMSARINGVWQRQRLQVDTTGQPVRMSFVATGR